VPMRERICGAFLVVALTVAGGCASKPATVGTNPTAALPPTPTSHATEINPPGDIPDNQAFVPYTPPGSRFSVKVPEGWAQSGTTTTTFADKLNSVQVAAAKTQTRPLARVIRATDVSKLKAQVPNFELRSVDGVKLPAGPAILTTFRGDSKPDPVTGKVVRDAFERFTFYRAGTRLDLTLVGPVNADNVDPWRTISESVRWR
jgi:hypothetical protein